MQMPCRRESVEEVTVVIAWNAGIVSVWIQTIIILLCENGGSVKDSFQSLFSGTGFNCGGFVSPPAEPGTQFHFCIDPPNRFPVIGCGMRSRFRFCRPPRGFRWKLAGWTEENAFQLCGSAFMWDIVFIFHSVGCQQNRPLRFRVVLLRLKWKPSVGIGNIN